jgi:hypothetical protein
MRVYEGAPRQNYQEVLRSLGALLDQRGMREILVTEIQDGFIVQGLAPVAGESAWSDTAARLEKESLTILDDDIARFMDEALARRNQAAQAAQAGGQPAASAPAGGFYEKALRVLGAYIDQQKPRDIFFLEQDHAFVLRLLMPTRTGARHVLAEFTSDDIEGMVGSGPSFRGQPAGQASSPG